MEANAIQRNIDHTLRTLAATGALLKGSVSKVQFGKKKKGRGDRIAYLLTYKGDAQVTRSLYVPKDQVATVTTMIRNHRNARKALEKLVELNVQLFKTTRPRNRIASS